MRSAFATIIVFALLSCRDARIIRVRFETADKVKPGDIVLLHDAKVGAVKALRTYPADKSTIVVISFDHPIDIPAGSAFVLSYDIFGTPFISITPSNGRAITNRKLIQHGKVE